MPKQEFTSKPLPPLTAKDIARFNSKVDRSDPDGCHPWKTGRYDNDYGMFYLQGRTVRANRVAYFLKTGEDPYPFQVLHTCDNPPCCREEHIFKGTGEENMQDASRKGRMASRDRHWSRSNPEKVKRGDQHHNRLHPERMARGYKNGAYTHPEKVHYKYTKERAIEIIGKCEEYKLLRFSLRKMARLLDIDRCTLMNILSRNRMDLKS